MSVAARFDLNPRANLVGALPVLGASLLGGAAGGLAAQSLTREASCALVGAGLGSGIAYVLSSVAVLALEMKEQPPLYQLKWRNRLLPEG